MTEQTTANLFDRDRSDRNAEAWHQARLSHPEQQELSLANHFISSLAGFVDDDTWNRQLAKSREWTESWW